MAGLIPLGEIEAASDVTTGAVIREPGSWAQRAVDERIEGVAVEIISDSPTVVAAAQAAVGSAGEAVFFRQGGPTDYLGNPDFTVAPVAANTVTEGNWYNVDGTVRSWADVADRPEGVTGKVLRFTAGGAFASQRVPNVASRGLDRKLTITPTARALVNGAVNFCRLRIIVSTPAGTLVDFRPADVYGLTWQTKSYDIDVPAGAAWVSVGLSVSTVPGEGSGRAEYASVHLNVAGSDFKAATSKVVGEQLAAGAGDARYVQLTQRAGRARSQEVSYSKSGVVGTNGRVPIALRFDDWQDNIKALGLHTELRNRGLPWSIVLCSQLGSNTWNDEVTWPDLRDWVRNYGAEVWSHGTNHQPPSSPNYDIFMANLRREIVQSKADIEAQGIRVMGWAQPGVTAPGYGFGSTNALDEFHLYDSDAGRLLLSTYGLVETDVTGYLRNLPSDLRYGLSHATWSDGVPMAETTRLIDTAIDTGMGLELMCHAGNLGVGANATVAQTLTMFDYLVTKRDEGLIDILTPSSLPFADPSSSRRLDLIANGDFAKPIPASSTTVRGNWRGVGGADAAVADVADGPDGAGRVLRTGAASGAYQSHQQPFRRGISGQTFMLDAFVRGVGGTPDWHLKVNNITQNHPDALDIAGTTAAGWTRVRRCFTVPFSFDNATATDMGLWFSSTGAGQVEWSKVRVLVA